MTISFGYQPQRHFYITSDGKIHKVSRAKFGIYEPKPNLCGQNVLHVVFVYETKNRKPWSIIEVVLDRKQLDENGAYHLGCKESTYKLQMHYIRCMGMEDKESVKGYETPMIPPAPVRPTPIEKEAIINLLKSKFPELWKSDPLCLEKAIQNERERYKKTVALFK